jgi:hypothetical protein
MPAAGPVSRLLGPLVPPAQGRQLLAFRAGQPAIAPRAGVPFGLAHPLPDRGLGQVEVPRDLAGRPVPALAQLHDLGLELRRERAAAPGLLPHALHDRTSFRGRTPDDGCPSKRVRPTGPAWLAVSTQHSAIMFAMHRQYSGLHFRRTACDFQSFMAPILWLCGSRGFFETLKCDRRSIVGPFDR